MWYHSYVESKKQKQNINNQKKQKQSHKNREQIYCYWKERGLEMLAKWVKDIKCILTHHWSFICSCQVCEISFQTVLFDTEKLLLLLPEPMVFH